MLDWGGFDRPFFGLTSGEVVVIGIIAIAMILWDLAEHLFEVFGRPDNMQRFPDDDDDSEDDFWNDSKIS